MDADAVHLSFTVTKYEITGSDFFSFNQNQRNILHQNIVPTATNSVFTQNVLRKLNHFRSMLPSYWSQWIPEICNKTDCPKNKYMLKVNNKKTRERCEICSKLTRKIPERRHWRQLLTFSEPANVHWIVSMLQKLASNELNLKSSTTCIKFFVWLVSFLRIWGS